MSFLELWNYSFRSFIVVLSMILIICCRGNNNSSDPLLCISTDPFPSPAILPEQSRRLNFIELNLEKNDIIRIDIAVVPDTDYSFYLVDTYNNEVFDSSYSLNSVWFQVLRSDGITPYNQEIYGSHLYSGGVTPETKIPSALFKAIDNKVVIMITPLYDSLTGTVGVQFVNNAGESLIRSRNQPSFSLLQRNLSSTDSSKYSLVSTSDGLSNNDINTIAEDYRGYIWIGTRKGLNKYDGNNIKVFLPEHKINVLLSDNNTLWIGTELGGLIALNIDTEQITEYKKNDTETSLSHDSVYGLARLNDGRIAVATGKGGLNILNPRNGRFERFNTIGDGTGTNSSELYGIATDNDGDLWISTIDKGINLFDPDTMQFTYFNKADYKVATDYIIDAFCDTENNLWFSTKSGIIIYNKNTQEFKSYYYSVLDQQTLSSGRVNSIVQDKTGKIIAGTSNWLSAINFNTDTIERVLPPDITETANIRTVFCDSGNNLWIGTRAGLVLYKSRQLFEPIIIDQQTPLQIRTFYSYDNGDLLIGTLHGLYFKKNHETTHSKINSKWVSSLVDISNNRIAIGYYNSIEICDIDNISVPIMEAEVRDLSVISLSIEKDKIYGGNFEGDLYIYDLNNKTIEEIPIIINETGERFSDTVYDVLDCGDYLLIGTGYSGIIKYDKANEEFSYFNADNEPYADNFVKSIVRDGNNLWIGSILHGLAFYDSRTKKFKYFTTNNGLPSNHVKAIAVTDKKVFFTTDNGFCVMDKTSNRIINYGIESGIPELDFFNGSVYTSSTGRIYFGSNKGYFLFDPDNTFPNTSGRMVSVFGIKVFDEDRPINEYIKSGNRIVIPNRDNYFTLIIGAINPAGENNNQYFYTLNRNRREWRPIENGKITFTNLAYGTYNLVLTDSQSGSDTNILYKLIVKPPFYMSIWALIIYTIILAGFIFYLILNNLLLDKKVKERTRELEELTIEKTNIFVNLAHETRTPLTIIANYLDRFIKENGQNKNIDVIRRSINKLIRDMVNYLDYEKLQRGQIFFNHNLITNVSAYLNEREVFLKNSASMKKINYSQKTEADLYVKADPLAVDRIINNLVDNAIKYTPENGNIQLELAVVGAKICIIVNDTGIGIEKDNLERVFKPYYQISTKKRNIQGVGMGLSIVKKILDDMNGSIEIESTPDIGTTVRVYLNKYDLAEGDMVSDFDGVKIQENLNVSSNILIENKQYDQSKKTLLIVEDNIDLQNFIIETLSPRYNLLTALNGSAALSKLKNSVKPDLIISDIMMDIMDGIEFRRRLILNDQFRVVPFIFLTAKSSVEDKISGLSGGAVDYITKPFLIRELEAKIDSIINISEEQRESVFNEAVDAIYDRKKNIVDSQTKKKVYFDDKCNEFKITDRQKEIIELLIDGKEYKEIAQSLNLSVKTIDNHIQNIYQKTNTHNKIELVSIFTDF